MDSNAEIAVIAKALYQHWQRDVGEFARIEWEDASPAMVRIFLDKAEAAFNAYWEFVEGL